MYRTGRQCTPSSVDGCDSDGFESSCLPRRTDHIICLRRLGSNRILVIAFHDSRVSSITANPLIVLSYLSPTFSNKESSCPYRLSGHLSWLYQLLWSVLKTFYSYILCPSVHRDVVSLCDFFDLSLPLIVFIHLFCLTVRPVILYYLEVSRGDANFGRMLDV